MLKQGQLQEKELFEAQARLRPFRLLGRGGSMHGSKGLCPSHQFHFPHHPLGQRLRHSWLHRGGHIADQLGQALAVQPLTSKLFRAGVDRMQPIPFSRLKVRQQLHLRWAMFHLPLYRLGLP